MVFQLCFIKERQVKKRLNRFGEIQRTPRLTSSQCSGVRNIEDWVPKSNASMLHSLNYLTYSIGLEQSLALLVGKYITQSLIYLKKVYFIELKNGITFGRHIYFFKLTKLEEQNTSCTVCTVTPSFSSNRLSRFLTYLSLMKHNQKTI